MSCGRHRWGLGSLLLLLAGRNLGILIEIHQDSINGTTGQAVLLPVSYRFDGAPHFPMPIQWTFSDSPDAPISCTVLNCSLGAGGTPSSCSARCYPHATYRGRVELFPENGSLLLRDLQLSDSGVYSVTFTPSPPTRLINLTVHEPRFAPDRPGPEPGGGGGTAARVPCYVLGGCYCFILLLLQLLFHLRWQRPNSRKASGTVSRSAPGPESRPSQLRHGAAPQLQ